MREPPDTNVKISSDDLPHRIGPEKRPADLMTSTEEVWRAARLDALGPRRVRHLSAEVVFSEVIQSRLLARRAQERRVLGADAMSANGAALPIVAGLLGLRKTAGIGR